MDLLVKSGLGTRALFAPMRPGRLLDIPAGEGEQSRILRERGFQVVSADLFAHASARRGLLWTCADANQLFPFRDASFDYVLSREGIEHLENQVGFVRECARVLRPGGTLVITTPNLGHLSARLSQFLTGQRNLRRGLINEVQTLRTGSARRPYHGHAFMIDYFRLRYILRLSGFEAIEVFTDRFSPTSVALCWLAPLLYAASRFSVRTAARKARRKGLRAAPASVTDEIIRHVTSPALLFGKRMILTARKTDQPQGAAVMAAAPERATAPPACA